MTIVDFDINNFSVSINIGNRVTGSLGDHATYILRDGEKNISDFLCQTLNTSHHTYLNIICLLKVALHSQYLQI